MHNPTPWIIRYCEIFVSFTIIFIENESINTCCKITRSDLFNEFIYEFYFCIIFLINKKIHMYNLTLQTPGFPNMYKLSTRAVFENPKQNFLLKIEYWVITHVQMTFYSIGAESINNWIHFHSSITNFLRQTVN